jgi:hypothetical protein
VIAALFAAYAEACADAGSWRAAAAASQAAAGMSPISLRA